MAEVEPDVARGGPDDRWGGRVPWFRRYTGAATAGSFDKCLADLGQILGKLFDFNEAEILNLDQFGAQVETDSERCFRHRAGIPLGEQLRAYFNPRAVDQEANSRALGDPIEDSEQPRHRGRPGPAAAPMSVPTMNDEYARRRENTTESRPARVQGHRGRLLAERLTVLESVLANLSTFPKSASAPTLPVRLIPDIRRAFAASDVLLDLRGEPARIVPTDERLLQGAVVEPLLARLEAFAPARARELVTAYHDLLTGKPLDDVFGGAYRTLEEIGRGITANGHFALTEKDLGQYFPALHPTIKKTISALRAHRGDRAGHGRKSPELWEGRYLLFQVCNVALLLLDYAESAAGPEAIKADRWLVVQRPR